MLRWPVVGTTGIDSIEFRPEMLFSGLFFSSAIVSVKQVKNDSRPISGAKKGITLYRTELGNKVKVYFVKNFDTMAWFFLFISIYYEYFFE